MKVLKTLVAAAGLVIIPQHYDQHYDQHYWAQRVSDGAQAAAQRLMAVDPPTVRL